jgi:hypothetical protein
MTRRNRTQLVLGIILILIAAWLILGRFEPRIAHLIQITFSWPVWVLLAGALILLIGLLVGEPGMAVPACIVAGIGTLLYYQNATGNWASWGYLWTLIPGFVGIGSLLAGVLGEDFKRSIRSGLNLLLISLVLFLIFTTLLGGWTILGPYSAYAPIAALLLLGLWLIARGVFRHG